MEANPIEKNLNQTPDIMTQCDIKIEIMSDQTPWNVLYSNMNGTDI